MKKLAVIFFVLGIGCGVLVLAIKDGEGIQACTHGPTLTAIADLKAEIAELRTELEAHDKRPEWWEREE